MNIPYTKITVTMKSDVQGNIGEFPGSAIRGALMQSLVYRHCESLKYGQCDICKSTDCIMKYCFKPDLSGQLATNPIVLNTDYIPCRTMSDTLNFSIMLYGDTTQKMSSEIKKILNAGMFMGSPKVEFKAESVLEESSTIDLSILDKCYDEYSNSAFKIKLITPYVSKGKTPIKDRPQKFIKGLTIRVTSIVNILGIDYHVPYESILDVMNTISISDIKLNRASIQRKSTNHGKYQLVHGEIGEFTLHGDFSKIYPFLVIASKLSIGKECTMGFGQFSWEEVNNT